MAASGTTPSSRLSATLFPLGSRDERGEPLHPLLDGRLGVHRDLELAARQLAHLAGRGGPERDHEALAVHAERIRDLEDGVDLLHADDLKHGRRPPWRTRGSAATWCRRRECRSPGARVPCALRARQESGSPWPPPRAAPSARSAAARTPARESPPAAGSASYR